MNFPESKGFTYQEEFDEWVKPTFEGKLVLWIKPTNRSFWVLSYVDKEDYLHPICQGYEHIILGGLVAHERDRKISELFDK